MAKTSTIQARKAASRGGRRQAVCFVYMLGTSDKDGTRTYVGWTLDLDRRLAQHNGGKGARSTRGRTWILLHVERFATRQQAMSREWHLKRDRPFRKLLAQKIVR
jgi:putative endonuclease